MANQNEAIPSARVKLFLVPADAAETLALGLVEDCSARNDADSENFRTIGDPIPPDNVTNFEQGRVRLGKVFQPNDAQRAVLAPTVAAFTRYKAFDLLALDPLDGKYIFMAIGVRPSSFEFMARGGSAPRDNYDGICRVVLFGDEIAKAMAA